MPCARNTGKIHSIEAYEYVRRKYHKNASDPHEKVFIPFMIASPVRTKRHRTATLKASQSIASSPQFFAALPGPSCLVDVFDDNLDEDWEFEADDGEATSLGLRKELLSTFDRYRHLLINGNRI